MNALSLIITAIVFMIFGFVLGATFFALCMVQISQNGYVLIHGEFVKADDLAKELTKQINEQINGKN